MRAQRRERLRTKTGEVIATDSLAWLWISWVQKFGLSLQILADVCRESGDATTCAQAKIVLDYFNYRDPIPRHVVTSPKR